MDQLHVPQPVLYPCLLRPRRDQVLRAHLRRHGVSLIRHPPLYLSPHSLSHLSQLINGLLDAGGTSPPPTPPTSLSPARAPSASLWVSTARRLGPRVSSPPLLPTPRRRRRIVLPNPRLRVRRLGRGRLVLGRLMLSFETASTYYFYRTICITS